MAHNSFLLAQLGQGGSATSMLLFMGLIFAIMYFIMIRPQQKRDKEHRALLSGLKKGDEVLTQSGLLGKIYAITDKMVTLEVANGVRVRVLKGSVQSLANLSEEASGTKAEEKKEDK